MSVKKVFTIGPYLPLNSDHRAKNNYALWYNQWTRIFYKLKFNSVIWSLTSNLDVVEPSRKPPLPARSAEIAVSEMAQHNKNLQELSGSIDNLLAYIKKEMKKIRNLEQTA